GRSRHEPGRARDLCPRRTRRAALVPQETGTSAFPTVEILGRVATRIATRRRVVERRRFGRRVGVDGPRWARLHYAQSGDAMPSHVLAAIRQVAGPRRTEGLSDATIERFLSLDPNLGRALEEA